MMKMKPNDTQTTVDGLPGGVEQAKVQGIDEGGATVNHEGPGHADAMEPYGDDLAMSDQVAVHAPTNGPDAVTAPTGTVLPAETHGTDPEGPVVTGETTEPTPEMITIIAPSEAYTGTSAGVDFVMGKGQTCDANRVEWFREHGYQIGGKATEGDN